MDPIIRLGQETQDAATYQFTDSTKREKSQTTETTTQPSVDNILKTPVTYHRKSSQTHKYYL